MNRALAIVAVACCLAASANGSDADRSPKNEITLWGGSSAGSNGHVFGFARDRRLVQFGASYDRRMWSHSSFSLAYRAEVIPIALLFEPKQFGAGSEAIGTGRRSTYGGGLNPLGLKLKLRPAARVQPYFDYAGGFLYFTDRVLSPLASQYNFTVYLGTGLEFRTGEHKAIQFGYRYHHLSNANISNRNPGVDTNFFYMGFTFLR